MKRAAAIVGILLEDEEEEFDAHADFVSSYGVDAVCKSLGFEWLNWNVYYKEIGPWRVYVDPERKNHFLDIEVGYYQDGDQNVVFSRCFHLADGYGIVQAVVDYVSKTKLRPDHYTDDIHAYHLALSELLDKFPRYTD